VGKRRNHIEQTSCDRFQNNMEREITNLKVLIVVTKTIRYYSEIRGEIILSKQAVIDFKTM
jgi:hypothetical protein